MARTYSHVDLTPDDLRALAEHYDGLRFTLVRARWIETDDPNDLAADDGHVERVQINVVGPAELLLRHGFIARGWSSLPPCGVRNHHTEGFGRGNVRRRKKGDLLVHGWYDDALDKIAPVLTAPLLNPFKVAFHGALLPRGPVNPDRVRDIFRRAEELLRRQGYFKHEGEQDDGGVRA